MPIHTSLVPRSGARALTSGCGLLPIDMRRTLPLGKRSASPPKVPTSSPRGVDSSEYTFCNCRFSRRMSLAARLQLYSPVALPIHRRPSCIATARMSLGD